MTIFGKVTVFFPSRLDGPCIGVRVHSRLSATRFINILLSCCWNRRLYFLAHSVILKTALQR